MVSRSSISRQPVVVGGILIALLFGVYQFVSQSGLLPTNPPTEQTQAGKSAEPVGYEPIYQDQALPSNFSSTLEPGTEDQILPPAESLVSFRNGPVREFPSKELVSKTPDYGRSGQLSTQDDIQVYFSPKGGCTAAIVAELSHAQRQILIQAYSFTSQPIAKACVEAHKRGVQVCAVLDKSQETEQYSAADFLANSGIPTLIDAQHAIAHNKVILIDGVTLITGSFNFTSNAEQSNAENMLIIRNRPDLYSAYEKNLQLHWEHSKPHVARGTTSNSTGNNNHHRK